MTNLSATLNGITLVGSLGSGKVYVNDYTITLESCTDGYKLTVAKGSETQTATLLCMTAEELEQIRGAEAQRAAAEGLRVIAENNRASAESSRANAETARVNAETARASAEQTRSSNEVSREGAETQRTSNENLRKEAETARVNAEIARVAAESARVSAETARVSAETERNTEIAKTLNMTVSAESLEAGSSATVEKTLVDGAYNLAFGIPKGDTGDKGDKGDTGRGVDPVLQKPLDILRGVNVLKLENGYGVDVKATDYMIPVTGEVYVDVATGDDANAGTESAPLKSITAALAKDANTIYVAEGVYDGENGFNGTTVSKAVNIIGSGKVVFRPNAAMNTTVAFYADGETGVVRAKYDASTVVIGVIDVSTGTRYAYKNFGRGVTPVSNLISSTEPGFATTSSNLWIRTFDGRSIIGKTSDDSGIVVCARNTSTNVTFTKNTYLRGIAFELGGETVFASDGYLCADGCRFDCSEYKNGLSVTDASGVFMFDCTANGNRMDGFNYHQTAGAYEVLEVNCKAFGNGVTDTAAAVSDNGSTAHQGIGIIRIGCEYGRNYGGNIADKGNTKAWCVGCYAHDSKATAINTGMDVAYNADYWIETNAVMYCHDCKAGGSTYGGWAYDNSAMYLSQTAFKSTYVDASTIAAYHQYAADVSALNNSVAALQSGKQDVISDLASIRAKANSAVQTETDPTVPDWAKAESKPTYQANEIAMGDTTVGAVLSEQSAEIAVIETDLRDSYEADAVTLIPNSYWNTVAVFRDGDTVYNKTSASTPLKLSGTYCAVVDVTKGDKYRIWSNTGTNAVGNYIYTNKSQTVVSHGNTSDVNTPLDITCSADGYLFINLYQYNSSCKVRKLMSASKLNADIAELGQLKPETAPSAVGKILKVLSVNDDGTFTCEWADAPSGSSTDVQINGTSITQDGVANIPLMANGTTGVTKISTTDSSGLEVVSGVLKTIHATDAQIANRNNSRRHISPQNLVTAVNSVLCSTTASEALTTTEQANARKRIGLDKEWTLVGTIAGTAEDRGNIDTGATVDLSGCTEIIIKSNITATSNVILMLNDKHYFSQIGVNGTRSAYAHCKDELDELFCDVYMYGTALNATMAGNGVRYNFPFNATRFFVKDVNIVKFQASSVVTSCDIKIYAR